MTLSAEPILVGREKELNKLNIYLDLANAGNGATIFVSGEAGSGKTRLINEFITAARKKGAETLTGWCLSNATIPYFPFIEAFETYMSQNENAGQYQVTKKLNPKAWFVNGDAEKLIQASPQTWKDQKFTLVMQSLLALSAKKPLVLFIDDLHWADSASLSLLHYIARQICSERILIVATFRSEELIPPTEGSTSPLFDKLLLMGREDLYKEIKLPNLNLPNTKKVAESLLRGPVECDLAEEIFNESRGNPLFTIESLRMLSENQCLTKDADIWKLNVTKLGVPKKVRDIIIHRLNGLKPSQRRILDVASVIGDKFNPELIGTVLNTDSLQILEELTSIALSKSLVIEEGDYYRFDHAKTREILYENLLQPLKKGYHLRIAEKLENEQKKFAQ